MINKILDLLFEEFPNETKTWMNRKLAELRMSPVYPYRSDSDR